MNKVLLNKHILIIVENLPVPFDRRVWQEANALKEAGADVSIICPKMDTYVSKFETINGISIYRHPLPEAKGLLGYLIEYPIAIFWWFILSFKIFLKNRFDVIHGCNPPDLIFIVAIFYKLFGVKFVFDHHDVNPELYISKFGKKDFFYHLMVFLEKLTFSVANFSIATNNSYRDIAIKRGGMNSNNVTVVRSGPNLERMKIVPSDETLKKGRKYFVGYVGVIGEQEGVDLLLESIKFLSQQRQDIQFGIAGRGPHLDYLKELSKELGISEYVDFYGRVSDEKLLEILNTADICVNPDKPTEMNDISTMNKIMEYMSLAKPIVQFDLKEGRYSARDASLYAKNGDCIDFANKIIELLDDEPKRIKMGIIGFERVKNELSWNYEKENLINFYKKVTAI